MVRAVAAFTEFCYLARRSVFTDDTIKQLEDALALFHQYREIFRTTGVRQDFNPPRQHSLVHYPRHIREFGAPNGLCSSITESKHIKAIKEPYRRSSRFEALGQMLLINQRLDKLAAARVDFEARGMLKGSLFSSTVASLLAALNPIPDSPERAALADEQSNYNEDSDDNEPESEDLELDIDESGDEEDNEEERGGGSSQQKGLWTVVEGPPVEAYVRLAARRGTRIFMSFFKAMISGNLISFVTGSRKTSSLYPCSC